MAAIYCMLISAVQKEIKQNRLLKLGNSCQPSQCWQLHKVGKQLVSLCIVDN